MWGVTTKKTPTNPALLSLNSEGPAVAVSGSGPPVGGNDQKHAASSSTAIAGTARTPAARVGSNLVVAAASATSRLASLLERVKARQAENKEERQHEDERGGEVPLQAGPSLREAAAEEEARKKQDRSDDEPLVEAVKRAKQQCAKPRAEEKESREGKPKKTRPGAVEIWSLREYTPSAAAARLSAVRLCTPIRQRGTAQEGSDPAQSF